ncbi:putative MscS mechanosensitive ion channel [Cellulomonas flavigena DSM 20109]|uniref:Putative MscS mechanosensitive ion channel n=1 Tax=Cellulomonas flavigena (strain ATCC 482 / DSM 20109 / BCRC 11376 / JCM 18109 / NBRC 3775 / NCIMB 8073 / NRS 134) TaxID=446466 RepID=D5UFJ5_CELFN|nr:putative MscS mechanosensitive ion channel [Cellulomonas flavigena DSM 20109]
MNDPGIAVHVAPARSGRPPSRSRDLKPHELVRVEIRMPAAVAGPLFARARAAERPVSAVASDLLAAALADAAGDAMA